MAMVCVSACYSQSKPVEQVTQTNDSIQSTFWDDTTQLWLDGKLFYKWVIRVEDGDEGFMAFDIDTIKGVLDSANREDYYRQFRKQIPKGELKAHRMAWRLKELDFQQRGNGGLYTVMTSLIDTPTVDHPYYTIHANRLYEDRIGAVIPIPYLKINIKTGHIDVESAVTGEQLTLAQWRKNGGLFDWEK